MTEQDGNFHSISFYSILEHLSSNFKNIKESLCFMTKYIKNKSIKRNKINDVLDLSSVGEAAWNFISALYKSGWNSLVSNKDNQTFRQKITSKLTLKIQEIKKKFKSNKQFPSSSKRLVN